MMGCELLRAKLGTTVWMKEQWQRRLGLSKPCGTLVAHCQAYIRVKLHARWGEGSEWYDPKEFIEEACTCEERP